MDSSQKYFELGGLLLERVKDSMIQSDVFVIWGSLSSKTATTSSRNSATTLYGISLVFLSS